MKERNEKCWHGSILDTNSFEREGLSKEEERENFKRKTEIKISESKPGREKREISGKGRWKARKSSYKIRNKKMKSSEKGTNCKN